MKNNLKKWPFNWIEHVTETCFFHFENKGISFVDSKILCSDKTEKAKIYGMPLTFKKDNKTYDISINHEASTFIINYYYKNYYRFKKGTNQNFIFIIDTLLNGSDGIGLFNYFDLGGELTRDYKTSAYKIVCSIEEFIDYHSNGGYEDNDNEGGENDPIEPFSPYDVVEPELLSC